MKLPHPDERRRALEARNPTWQSRTIAQALDAAAAEFPDRPLVITDDRTYTYRDIAEWSERLANGLIALGVEPGEHVALIMANYPEFVATKFAIARAGATCIPVNFLFRANELGYVLRQSDAVALIAMDRFRDLDYLGAFDAVMPGWESAGGGEVIPKLREVVIFSPDGEVRAGARPFAALEELAADAPAGELERRAAAADPATLSDILYTSGTTGSPKGVMITHDMVVRTAYGAAYNRALSDGHRMIHTLPMYHVFGYVECLMASMFVGGAVILRPQFAAAAMLDGVARYKANELVLVPTMTWAILAEAEKGDYDLESLTTVFSSGGAVPDSIWDDIQRLLGPVEITTGYGMTETTAATTCTKPEDPPERLTTTNGGLRLAGVAGDPELGGYLAIYKTIDPQTGEDLAPGEAGELMARGPIVTPGYYNKPEETAAVMDNGWMHTGDIGTLDAEGYLRLVGRIKESYRCGGEMVMPREVESVLEMHSSVDQAHVVGIPDPRMGEIGCAFIVAEEGEQPDPEELISHCKERLARFKVPKYVLFTEAASLPLTATGRVQKFKLVERAKEELASEAQATGAPASS
jgi:fatty-acyl-CoA synthase